MNRDIDKLLIVDPFFHRRAPTMRGIISAAEEVLPNHFRRVEVWSMENELAERNPPWLSWRRVPKISPFWPIQCSAFRTLAWRMFRQLPADELAHTLTFCSGEHLPMADIRYIQFWNLSQRETSERKPDLFRTRFRDRIFGDLAIRGERFALRPGNTGEWWCVSRGIAEPILQAAPSDSVFRFLPNTYDPNRFNPETRIRHREGMRRHYGFSERDIVLTFCSFGHFARKGLPQAIQAVNKLRQLGHPVRLLVLGGNEPTVAGFRQQLKRDGISEDATRFAGMVSPPEHHLAAGDALFFPSHFEAFSLVEIEAAALGMRLYLTAHPGSEMILREGANGRLLPWEVDGMVTVLDEEIRLGKVGLNHCEMGDALTPDEYARQLSRFYHQAIERKSRQA